MVVENLHAQNALKGSLRKRIPVGEVERNVTLRRDNEGVEERGEVSGEKISCRKTGSGQPSVAQGKIRGTDLYRNHYHHCHRYHRYYYLKPHEHVRFFCIQ